MACDNAQAVAGKLSNRFNLHTARSTVYHSDHVARQLPRQVTNDVRTAQPPSLPPTDSQLGTDCLSLLQMAPTPDALGAYRALGQLCQSLRRPVRPVWCDAATLPLNPNHNKYGRSRGAADSPVDRAASRRADGHHRAESDDSPEALLQELKQGAHLRLEAGNRKPVAAEATAGKTAGEQQAARLRARAENMGHEVWRL